MVSIRDDKGIFEVSVVDWNGDRFGVSAAKWYLESFTGDLEVISLPVFPLKTHPDRSQERAKLIAQGRAFQNLSGQHFETSQVCFLNQIILVAYIMQLV